MTEYIYPLIIKYLLISFLNNTNIYGFLRFTHGYIFIECKIKNKKFIRIYILYTVSIF